MARSPTHLPAELTGGPLVVKAWAPWCGSCRALAPHVEAAASRSDVPVFDLRVDLDGDHLVEALGVRSVPTLIGLRDGAEVGRLTGAQPPDTIEALFTTIEAGTGRITNQTPTGLATSRGAAGVALAIAGLVFGSIILLIVGVALVTWGISGGARRRLQ